MSGMLEVKSFEFGPFGTNTYVVRDENTILLIDPACSNQYEQQQLYAYINSLNVKPSTFNIIATHGHLDHLWGANWATEEFGVPVLMSDADIPMAKAMQQQYDLFGIRMKAQSFPIESLESQISNLKSQMSTLEVLETPGHTPGSICLYWPEEKTLISGDTLFQMGYGRTDLPGGNMSQLINSLDQLFTLPPDTKVYPGHGNFTTIGAENRL